MHSYESRFGNEPASAFSLAQKIAASLQAFLPFRRLEMKGVGKAHMLCPSYGMSNKSVFYRKSNIPVNSCVLPETAQQATPFPKATLF